MGANDDIIKQLTAKLTKATTDEQGATTLINTMAAAAVEAAITPESKAAVQAAMDAFTNADDVLSSALAANTPAGPVVTAPVAPVTPAATSADDTPVTV